MNTQENVHEYADEQPLMPARRQEQIKQMITANGSVSVIEVVNRFAVSKATARRDIDDICRSGEFTRTHGGATLYASSTTYDKPHEDKMKMNYEQKIRIGRKAAEYVQNGDTIIIDSGTTGYALSQCLENKKQITVITNDLFIALNTVLDPSSSLIVLPGQRHDLTKVIIGKQAEDMLHNIRVVKFFMTADAICLESGVTEVNLLESGIKDAMVKAAQEIILIADSSKFEKKSLISVLPDLRKVRRIITDDGLSAALQKRYGQLAELVVV